jgi:Zn-dependent peptidase ImmA (M78 family)
VGNEQYPKRSMDEVEELANELLDTYFTSVGHSLNLPVPVEDIAEHFLGYSIDITNEGIFSDPGFLGGIDFEQNLIYVNASVEDHDGRYAFTVAHEIGHHALHREAYLSDNEQGEKEILCRDIGEKPHIEIEADRFAAALLMPSKEVLDVFSRLKLKRKVASIGHPRITICVFALLFRFRCVDAVEAYFGFTYPDGVAIDHTGRTLNVYCKGLHWKQKQC